MPILTMDLQKSEYHNWLKQFGGDQQVGETYDVEKHPLAQFLATRTEKRVMVTPVRYRVGDEVRSMPDWARRYMHRLDNMHVRYVRKRHAIKALHNALS